MLLDFKDKSLLNESIKLLKQYKFDKYKQYFLMFNNDYVSPIFNMNNKEIGIAYLYNQQTPDYSIYFINEKLKAFVKLYFNYLYLHSTNNNQRDGQYVLISPELINSCKSHFSYDLIKTKLNGNNMAQQVIKNFQNENRKMYDILSDKIIFGIIKYHLWDINQQFFTINNFINNIKEEPKSQKLEGNDYYSYYINFELIDEDIYKIIFNKNSSLLKECFFENNYMHFKLPGNLCGNKNPRNIEICKLNKEDNLFQASFLIECNKTNSLETFLENAKQNGGLDIYLNNFQFNNNIEQIYDNFKHPIGLIYNLIPPKPNPYSSIIEEFQQPPLIGLKNVGATCYMNATLQCLSQIAKLANYFKYHKTVEKKIEELNHQKCLTKSFKILIENLWPWKYSEYLNRAYILRNSIHIFLL